MVQDKVMPWAKSWTLGHGNLCKCRSCLAAIDAATARPAYKAPQDLQLERLERWAADHSAGSARAHEVEHPEAVAYAARISADAKARHQLAALERWAVATPYQPLGAQQQAAELHRTRRAKDNAYANAMAAWRASVVPCGHRSCMVGRCAYH